MTVWGWGLPSGLQAEISGDPLYGKGMALAHLGIPDRYYSFDQGGWRFLVLDSTHVPEGDVEYPYTGKLDEEQYQWLVAQLESTPDTMPVCVASHIPVLAACESGRRQRDQRKLGGAGRLGAHRCPPSVEAVRAAPQRAPVPERPHAPGGGPALPRCEVPDQRRHMRQLVEWLYFDFPPGYVVVTLYEDGSSESEFVAY